MTMLTRKTKAVSLAILAIAAFAIAAPQARAELPQGYEQLLYIETYEGGGLTFCRVADKQGGHTNYQPIKEPNN